MAPWFDGTTEERSFSEIESAAILAASGHVVNVTHHGALGDGVTTNVDAAAFQAAHDECYAAGGGVVLVPPGDYRFDDTVTGAVTAGSTGDDNRGVTFQGVGDKASRIRKAADVTLFDFSGTHPDTTTTGWCWWPKLRDLEIHGNATGSEPLIRAYYAKALEVSNCFVMFTGGASGMVANEIHDSRLSDVRFIGCRGSDGSSPALMLYSGDGASSGFGHSADSLNNLWMRDLHFEGFNDGALWTSKGSGSNGFELIYMSDVKMESNKCRSNQIRLHDVVNSRFVNLFLNMSGYDTGVTGPLDQMDLQGVRACAFDGLYFNSSNVQIRSCMKLSGTVRRNRFGFIASQHGASAPTVAVVDIAGSAATQEKNTWMMPLMASGTATQINGWRNQTVAPHFPLMYVAGAVSDTTITDLNMTPIDGMQVIDETNGRLYVRVNGTWKYAALT